MPPHLFIYSVTPALTSSLVQTHVGAHGLEGIVAEATKTSFCLSWGQIFIVGLGHGHTYTDKLILQFCLVPFKAKILAKSKRISE